MELSLHTTLARKLLQVCGSDENAAFYSVLPSIDMEHLYLKGAYNHNFESQKNMIESGIEVFTGKKTEIAKSSYEYQKLKKKKEELLHLLDRGALNKEADSMKLSDDKMSIALSLLSHLYFDAFTKPIQFFLPHSSLCSAQWSFWDKVGYTKLKERLNEKEVNFKIKDEILKSSIWDTKFKPEDFPEIVKRRLAKEKTCERKLDPNAMMKAMIIRMGEMAAPSINYEIIDFSIRSFFTYLGTKQYLRVDREIAFLRKLELELMRIIEGSI